MFTAGNRAAIMHANYARFNGYSGATGCDENSPDSGMFVSVSGEERLDTRRAKAPCPCLMFRHVFLSNLTFGLLSPPASSLLIAFHTYGFFKHFFQAYTVPRGVTSCPKEQFVWREAQTDRYTGVRMLLSVFVCAYTVIQRVCFLAVFKWKEMCCSDTGRNISLDPINL